MLTLIASFSTWGERFWPSNNFHRRFLTEESERPCYLTTFPSLLSFFPYFSFYMDCYLGILNYFLFIRQSSCLFPSTYPELLISNPSRFPAEARVLYLLLPTLLRGQSGLELETLVSYSNIAPVSFNFLLFYLSFENESSS